jgi:pSer/pThr/pTyr-binding forkhead associated (FHA) protein
VKGWLQLQGAGGAFWERPLAQSPFLIGRLSADDGVYPQLDLSPYDTQFVSRRHAQIVRCGNEYAIEDLDSANGTLVNGVRLAPHSAQVLHHGDRLRIGSVDLVFRLAGR